jgi:hypothetical protein
MMNLLIKPPLQLNNTLLSEARHASVATSLHHRRYNCHDESTPVLAARKPGWQWWHGGRDLLLVVVSGAAHSDLLLDGETSRQLLWHRRNP